MKQITKFFALAIVMFAFSTSAFAQGATATATATATIVAPIAITKNVDMNFGNVAVNSVVGGTVVLATDGSRTATGGVTLPATAGTVAAASFAVSGTTGYTYTVSITGAPLTVTSGGNTMTVTAFTNSATAPLVAGANTLTVGATLNVAVSQAPGLYVSGTPFSVRVDYN